MERLRKRLESELDDVTRALTESRAAVESLQRQREADAAAARDSKRAELEQLEATHHKQLHERLEQVCDAMPLLAPCAS